MTEQQNEFETVELTGFVDKMGVRDNRGRIWYLPNTKLKSTRTPASNLLQEQLENSSTVAFATPQLLPTS